MPSRKIWKQVRYGFFLLAFTILAAEIMLRFYNPFPTSVRGDRITLQTNTRITIKNLQGTMLDPTVTVFKNSIGFRGPEPPKNFNDELTILTIGGSTTECLFINEDNTWPSLLSSELSKSFRDLWLNNAGLNGHSTYGHIKLLRDYVIPLKPKICLFLVGCNDIDRPDLNRFDSSILNEHQSMVVTLARYSRLVNTFLNFYRHHLARQRELVQDVPYGLTKKPPRLISDSIGQQSLITLKNDVNRYGERLKSIISLCRESNILPIMITQPCLLGDAIDDQTGIDLSTYPFRDINGRILWSELELYNDETKKICAEDHVKLLDLGHQLPKSTKYFYDGFHFNNSGCIKVSELLLPELVNYLKEAFPNYQIRN